MQARTMWGGGAVALGLAALLVWAFAPRPVDVELALATLGPFETAISEDGKTQLRDRYTVSAPLTGRLARITLEEGDRVDAGAVVATLTPVLSPLLDERSQRELAARIEAAQANLARITARIEHANLGVAQARNDLLRSEQLAQQGFVAATRLDAERLAVQSAQREVDSTVQERHVARHELEQAQAALAATRAAPGGKPFELLSPVTGQVLRVLQGSATTVALGMPLLELGDLAQLEVVTELLTADALATPPGSPVRIERWGGPVTLAGRVRRVEPAAFTKVSALGVEEQRVRVLIDITSPPDQWRALGDGFRVGVRIVTQALPQVISVPVSAVFPLPAEPLAAMPASAPASGTAGEGADRTASRQAVFVVEAGRARLQPVRVGARNGNRAWVREGLAAGAQVVVYPGAAVTDGVRVKARKV